MGRSKPTVRNFIERRREEMDQYPRPLRRRHQHSYERLWEHAALDAPSIKMADTGGIDINFLILFAICRGQQREIEKLQEQIGGQQGEEI